MTKTKIILLLFFFLSKSYALKDYKIGFNTDVLVCSNSIISLTIAEQNALFPGKNLNLLYQKRDQNFYIQNLAEWNTFSPQRVKFIKDLLSQKVPNVIYQSQITLTRLSPVSALIVPPNCQVEPLTSTRLSFAPTSFVTYVNLDLFQKMDLSNQFLALTELALNIEQAIDSLNKVFIDPIAYSEVPFDLVISREFLRCWYSSLCRTPKMNLAQAHLIFKKYKLSFVEQSGILIPNSNKLSTYDNGIISFTDKIYNVFPPLSSYFHSSVQVGQKILDFSNYENVHANTTKTVIFTTSGNIQCLPISDRKTEFGPVTGFFDNHQYQFVSSPVWPSYAPVCFNQNGQVMQGFISFKSLIEIPFRNKYVDGALVSWDNYNTLNFGVFIRNYINGLPDLLYTFRGKGLIQNKLLPLNGVLKLRIDGSVECAEISTQVKLQTDKMQIYNHDPKSKNLLCFNDKQQLSKVLLLNEKIKLISSELPPY